MKIVNAVRVIALVVAVALIGAEVGLRYFGVVDFPLYENSPSLGYIPLPNQSGAFLRKNKWAFNELSMGVAEPFRPGEHRRNILLIGDSLVMGGNPVDQPARLGPSMNSICPQVWPVGAGSWAFLNELRYLHEHAGILSSFERIVFVLNSADFDEASIWTSETTHPTHPPLSALLYVASKLTHTTSSPSPTKDSDWRSELAWLRQHYQGPLTIVLYPTKEEAQDAAKRAEKLDSHASEIGGERADFTFIANDPSWTTRDYRDEIHPTNDANAKLAKKIAADIPECGPL